MTLSPLVSFQAGLFKKVTPNIIVRTNGLALVASNIDAEAFQFLEFIVNNPSFNDAPLRLAKINVFLNDSIQPTFIPGLFEIIVSSMNLSSLNAFVGKEIIYRPFIEGIGKQKLSILELINRLSQLSSFTPDILGKKVKLQLIFRTDILDDGGNVTSSSSGSSGSSGINTTRYEHGNSSLSVSNMTNFDNPYNDNNSNIIDWYFPT
jgi:hypothetical protein